MTQKLSAVLVDDNKQSALLIGEIIRRYIPELELIQVFDQPTIALDYILQHQPEVLFLDIDMPEYNGIELAKLLPEDIRKRVIYITGHQEYAISALKLGVQDYLLKPVTALEIREAVNRILEQLKVAAPSSAVIPRLVLNKNDRMYLIDFDDILYLNADGQYTDIYLADGRCMRSSNSLGYYKTLLAERSNFIPLHRSYIVNMNNIKEIEKDENNDGTILMSNGHQLVFSTKIKNKLIQSIQEAISKNFKG
ncbi:MAG: response regulator transcription factor [Bacteroidetes bacterium]|nr:response regulator transcription factor [Bacteroidota bacterium]